MERFRKQGFETRVGSAVEDSPEKKNKVRKTYFYVWTAVGICILIGVGIYLLNVMSLPIGMLLWTLIIVFCLRGIVDGLEARGVNRMIGTTIAYVIMALILGVIFLLIFTPMFGLSDQFANIINNIPGYIDTIMDWAQGQTEKYAEVLRNEAVRSFINSAGSSVSSWASTFASDAANIAVGVGTGVVNTFTAIGFAFVIAFWVLMELPAMGREVRRIVDPKYSEDITFLHVTFTRILGGYMKGTIFQCFLIGLACGILFGVLGIPNAPALGVITGVLNIIPIVGPWLGGIVAAISAVFISPFTAVIAIIGTIIIQQFVYTFVSPRIMANSVDIHPALTLIAMIFGSAIGGAMGGLVGTLVGMLFAIPLVAVAKSIFIYYFERSTSRQIVAEDGFLFKGTPTASGVADPLFDATNGNSGDSAHPPIKRKNGILSRLFTGEDSTDKDV